MLYSLECGTLQLCVLIAVLDFLSTDTTHKITCEQYPLASLDIPTVNNVTLGL